MGVGKDCPNSVRCIDVSEETDRRIEVARAKGERVKQTQEFMESLTKNDSLVKPIYNPEAYIFREKLRGAANRGELPKTECRHPFQSMKQFVDEDPAVARNGRPVNLFECGVCHMTMWIVDPWGTPVSDE